MGSIRLLALSSSRTITRPTLTRHSPSILLAGAGDVLADVCFDRAELRGLHGQLLCFRSGRRPEPHGSGDRVSRRTGRSARVLAPRRRKTSLDGSLAFWHHSHSTLQIFPFQG